MKLAIVHDLVKNISGDGNAFIFVHKIFPGATIYTLF